MAFKLGKNLPVVFLSLLLLVCGLWSVSASSVPSRVVNRFVSNALSMLMKWLGVSFKTIFRTAILRPSSVNFEGGYDVETLFDGSKHGIEPHSVGISPDGEILILDSANSNLCKISSSLLSMYSRPKLVTGSSGGYSGYVDGRLKQAMMNHPKGLTVDDRGNIYVADTNNMAIRKISENGVSTIAGGKHNRWGHVDGPSEDATFSNDFDVFYSRSSCSLLVIDRGNKAIREIHLHFDDCPYFYGFNISFGIAVVVAAVFFGYIIALLQPRMGSILFSQYDEPKELEPLLPENPKQLKPRKHKKHSKTMPVQEALVNTKLDEPLPTIETHNPTPWTTHTVPKDPEKKHRLTKRLAFYKGWWDQDFSLKQLRH